MYRIEDTVYIIDTTSGRLDLKEPGQRDMKFLNEAMTYTRDITFTFLARGRHGQKNINQLLESLRNRDIVLSAFEVTHICPAARGSAVFKLRASGAPRQVQGLYERLLVRVRGRTREPRCWP